MAIVVSDTSAIRALHHLNHLTLIRELYGELIVPPAVHSELRHPRKQFHAVDLVGMGLALVQSPAPEDVAKIIPLGLDPGETEAIALALSIPATFLLIDEMNGRLVAERLGIQIAGVVGVLIEAKRRRLIPAVAPLLTRLRSELQFRISPRFELEVLRNIGELPRP